MAVPYINFSSGVQFPLTNSSENSSIVATSFTVTNLNFQPGQLAVIFVSRSGNSAITSITDSVGNTYTLQISDSTQFSVAMFTSFIQFVTGTITVHIVAGSTTAVTITQYWGVGSIGSNKGSNSSSLATLESINCTLASPANWAVSGLSHNFTGGAPTVSSGNLRVTSVGAVGNNYSSNDDNTGSTSVVCSNTYGTLTAFEALFIELVPVSPTNNAIEQIAVGESAVNNTSTVTATTANLSNGQRFPLDSTNGNFLVCIILGAAFGPRNGSTLGTMTINPPSTPGITWIFGGFVSNTGFSG